jgi:hypothetical protein
VGGWNHSSRRDIQIATAAAAHTAKAIPSGDRNSSDFVPGECERRMGMAELVVLFA